MSFDLDTYLEEERLRVEEALERALFRLEELPGVDETTAAAMRHGVLSGGKRLRPVLCVTAWRACTERDEPPSEGGRSVAASQAIYDLAAALELIHAYSLVHDDLPCMDDAELRRGRPTTHRALGEDVAMRAGAVLIPGAALHARAAARTLGLGGEAVRQVVGILLEASGAGGMVGGQWLDLRGEGRALDAEELDGLHRRKTGALLTGSLLLGAAAAEAEEPVRDALRRYGRAVGLAFQVADDILDATQDAETLGKNPSDQELDKSTYVAVHGLGAARGRAAELVADAREALDGAGLAAPTLRALADFVVERRN